MELKKFWHYYLWIIVWQNLCTRLTLEKMSSVNRLCQVSLSTINEILTCCLENVNDSIHSEISGIVLPIGSSGREAAWSIQVKKYFKSTLWFSLHSNLSIVFLCKPYLFRIVEIASPFTTIIGHQLRYMRNNKCLL